MDRWYKKVNPGSDNLYCWGDVQEVAKWQKLTGDVLELDEEYVEGSSTNEINLEDEINRL